MTTAVLLLLMIVDVVLTAGILVVCILDHVKKRS
jgi:hypothetical protein